MGKRKIKGMAVTFETDRIGNKIDRKAMEKALKKCMATNPTLINDFKQDEIIGGVDRVVVTNEGVEIEAELFENNVQSDQSWDLINKGIIKGLGIGGIVRASKYRYGINEITDFDVWSFAICKNPIHKSCIITKNTDEFKTGILELENHHKIVIGL